MPPSLLSTNTCCRGNKQLCSCDNCVVCNLRPVAKPCSKKGETKDAHQQITAGNKQKLPLLMRQKACGSPTHPKSSQMLHKQSLKLRRARGRPISTAELKSSFFMASVDFQYGKGCNRAKKQHTLPFSVTDFEKAGFSSFLPLLCFVSALYTFTPPTTLCGLFLKVLHPPLVAFSQMMFFNLNLTCLKDHMLFDCKARALRLTAGPCLSV